jgi:hypothetical protein
MIQTFYTSTDSHEYRFSRDAQVIELCDLSSDVHIESEPEHFALSSPSYCEDSGVRFDDKSTLEPFISHCEDVEPTELSTPLSISLSNSQSASGKASPVNLGEFPGNLGKFLKITKFHRLSFSLFRFFMSLTSTSQRQKLHSRLFRHSGVAPEQPVELTQRSLNFMSATSGPLLR